MDARADGPTAWRVRLFGVLTLRYAGTVVDVPTAASARALLAYLVLHRERPQSRAALIERLWPELEEARGRRAITQALWHLRSGLPDLIDADDERVGLADAAQVWDDASRFEALTTPLLAPLQLGASVGVSASEPGLREAVTLYRGELLEGERAPWIEVERARHRERFLLALAALSDIERADGRLEAARETLQSLVAVDPLREDAQRALMRVLAALERPSAALQQFTRYRDLLAAELGEDPDAETAALARAIAKGAGPEEPAFVPLPAARARSAPQTGVLPLMGRDDERARLVGHVEAMIDGLGGVILIEGEPGVGKSRLLDELLRDATWRGADTLVGRPTADGSRAFGLLSTAMSPALSPLRIEQLAGLVDSVWLDVLAPYVPPIAHHRPERSVPSVAEPAASRRVRDAFGEVLAAWSRVAPLLVVLEDLHVADPDSVAVLDGLVARLSDQRALVIASYRGTEARDDSALWAALQALDRRGLRDRIPLARLDPSASADLLAAALGARCEEELAAAAVAGSGGNALFLRQLLLAWHEEQRIARNNKGMWGFVPDAGGGAATEPGARGTEEAAAARHAHGGGERSVRGEVEIDLEANLEVEGLTGSAIGAKSSGTSVHSEHAGAGTDDVPTEPAAVPEAVERVIEGRLDRLPPPARAVLEVAAILGREVRLALVREVAGLDDDALLAALRTLCDHGMLIETDVGYRFDHELPRAVCRLAMARSRYLALHQSAAEALVDGNAPDPARLAGHFRQAEAWGPAIDYALDAADAAQRSAATQSAWTFVDQALTLLDDHAPWSEADAASRRIRGLCLRRTLAWMRGDRARSDADAEAMALLAVSAAGEERQRLLRGLIHHAITVRKDFEAAVPLVAQAQEDAELRDDPLANVLALRDRAMLLRFQDRYDEARTQLERARALLRAEHTIPPEQTADQEGRVLGELSIVSRRSGELEAAVAYGQRAVEIAEALEHGELLVHALSCLYAATYWLGRLEACSALVERGRDVARRVGNRHNQAVFEGHRSMIAWSLRDYGTALESARASFALYDAIDDRLGRAIAAYGLGNLLLETGKVQEAAEILDDALRGYETLDQRLSVARILSTIADLHTQRGELDAARTRIEEGTAIALDIESDGALADLDGARGRLAMAEARPSDAAAAFRRALATFEAQGLTSHVPAVRAWIAVADHARGEADAALAGARRAWEELAADEGPEDVERALGNLVQLARDLGPAAEAAEWARDAARRVETFARSLPDAESRRTYREDVPAVRAILAAERAGRAATIEVRVPRYVAEDNVAAEHVSGAAPASDEATVAITWSPHDPADDAIVGKVARRRHRIARLLAEAQEQGGAPTSADLAGVLGVSRRTVERDLEAMRDD